MSDPVVDARYNSAGTRNDLDAVFARWRARSDAVKRDIPGERDRPYGDHPLERYDRFEVAAGAPLAIFFHGGYWRRLSKDDNAFVARGLAAHGIATATIEYPLAPAVPLESIVASARNAARRLAADASRVILIGHSAGGHLAAMCATDLPVHATVSISGLHDVRPLVDSFANEWLGLDATRAAALSPQLAAPAAPGHVLAIVGECELDGFQAQARSLVAAWDAHGCAGEVLLGPGDDHFTVLDRLENPDDPLTRHVARLAR